MRSPPRRDSSWCCGSCCANGAPANCDCSWRRCCSRSARSPASVCSSIGCPRALLSESATYLAADRVIASSHAIPDEFETAAQQLGLATARTMTFPSMVFAGERNQLVSVKAVSDGYPLRGVLAARGSAVRSGAAVVRRTAGGGRGVARFAAVSGARRRGRRHDHRRRRGAARRSRAERRTRSRRQFLRLRAARC